MSVNPTEYDILQDQEIQQIREVVTSTYAEQDRVEQSFPVVDRGMDDDQWGALMKAFGSGIISFGQFPYRLIVDSNADVTNQVRIIPATDVAEKDSVAVVEGFAHRLIEDKLLTVKAVTSRTRYIIALQYDPARAKADGNPVVLDVFAGTLDQSQGKKYVLIYEGFRDPSTVLSQMTWKPIRSRLAPTITVESRENLPNQAHSGLIWGTRCLCTSDGSEWMLVHHPTEARMMWSNISDPDWVPASLGANRVDANIGYPVAVQRKGNRVRLRGTVGRTGGADFTVTSDAYRLITLPPSLSPSRQVNLITAGGGFQPPTYHRIRILTTGAVEGVPGGTTGWIGLDGLEFDLE